MVGRLANILTKQSFFLFGARGTGKTSLVKERFSDGTYYIDLLNLELEAKYQLNPESLFSELSALPPSIHTVVIDEIQKVPKLLDVVHRKIESTNLRFVLTGSSARKLRVGAANLLAGRAVVFNLYPLLAAELGAAFNLYDALLYGTLPKVTNLDDAMEKRRFLLAYANTYLKEEVWGEQLVRKIEPFRRFLQIAAQTHGQQLNYSKISREVGVDDSTVQTYYSILEDTLVGFFLPAYAGSERKKLRKAPKFYLFDNGVKRALEGVVDFDLVPGTFEYGILFEQFVIAEIMRRAAYKEISLSYSFLATEGGVEVDLVIERGRKVVALIEIKSGKKVSVDQLKHLISLGQDFHGARLFCLYDGSVPSVIDGVQVLPWQMGIAELFELFKSA
ncbi:MAG: ATP-binding protein [Oligoflexia bacterium]|nr:ATP-binding protein [Oligoflexia bacterium]